MQNQTNITETQERSSRPRFKPVPIEAGDLICVNTSTNTVWISKEPGPKVPFSPPLTTPQLKEGQRHCPTGQIYSGKEDEGVHRAALDLAYVVAWVAGFRVEDVNEFYPRAGGTFVFRAVS